MRVPDDAEEVAVAHTDSGALGVWRLPDGTTYVAGYHFGPSGDVLFRFNTDGSVDNGDDLAGAAE